MKKLSWYLFPLPLVFFGYLQIGIAVALIILSVFNKAEAGRENNLAVPAFLMITGIIFVSFRSKLILDKGSLVKESGLPGLTLSHERVKIPGDCSHVLIKGQKKRGTGYYRFILPVSYTFKSWDMFLCSNKETKRLVNTDYKRAIMIAGFLKTNLNLDHRIEDLAPQKPIST